jgi:hypothetical protein
MNICVGRCGGYLLRRRRRLQDPGAEYDGEEARAHRASIQRAFVAGGSVSSLPTADTQPFLLVGAEITNPSYHLMSANGSQVDWIQWARFRLAGPMLVENLR